MEWEDDHVKMEENIESMLPQVTDYLGLPAL